MKLRILLLFVASITAAGADEDFLNNGDFSDGLAHWYGNIESAAEAPGDATSPTQGAVIKLNPHEWTKITQDFEIKPGEYTLHVAFTLSDGISFSDQLTDYIDIPGKLHFPPALHPWDVKRGEWVVAVEDFTAPDWRGWRVDPSSPTGYQSYHFTIKNGIDFTHKQTLMVAFPPGDGFVTVQRIVLNAGETP